MSDFQFFEKMGAVMNPLPRITRREMIEKAGFVWRPSDGPADAQDFAIELVYGAHQEIGVVNPGESLELQERGARIMYGIYGEKGLVVLDQDQDERELRLSGLERAITFHNYRGSQQLALVGMQLTEDEMRRLRREHRGLYLNQAREEVIEEEINRLNEIVDEPPKRPRGRPRKHPRPEDMAGPGEEEPLNGPNP